MPTQADNLGPTSVDINRTDNLLAGDLKRVERPILIPDGTAALVRGTIVTAAGVPLTAASTPAAPYGVLAVDTPALTTGDYKAYVYVTGEFNVAALVGFFEGDRAVLEAKNIYAQVVF